MIVLLVVTDGRDHITETLPLATANLRGQIGRRVIFDDTGSTAHRADLAAEFGAFTVIGSPTRLGFGGAIQAAWAWLLASTAERHVFHLEDDFAIEQPVDVDLMAAVLDLEPDLAQLALLRQPVNDAEMLAGGVIEQHPDDYTTRRWGNVAWREHRRHFTTNPSLYRRSLMRRGWPDGEQSEGRFGLDLFADPDVRCAYWGEGVLCRHVGTVRTGHSY